jgi:nitronate monooxygenase
MVTGPEEAELAARAGADALCVQGFEAGAHRGLFADDPALPAGGEVYGLLAALRLTSSVVEIPLIATGGLVHGADVAAVLVAGAVAAQLARRSCVPMKQPPSSRISARSPKVAGRPRSPARSASGRLGDW